MNVEGSRRRGAGPVDAGRSGVAAPALSPRTERLGGAAELVGTVPSKPARCVDGGSETSRSQGLPLARLDAGGNSTFEVALGGTVEG